MGVRKGELTRQAILDQAVGLATRVGLGGLTIGGLAEDLRLSKSGLFAHFRSKEALQIQVLEAASARFIDAVIRPALAERRGEPRVRAPFRAMAPVVELRIARRVPVRIGRDGAGRPDGGAARAAWFSCRGTGWTCSPARCGSP